MARCDPGHVIGFKDIPSFAMVPWWFPWVNMPSEPGVHFPRVRLFHIWWHIGSYFCAEAGDYASRTGRRIVWYLIRFPIPWVPLHDFCLYDPNWRLLLAWDNFGFSLESCTFLDPDSQSHYIFLFSAEFYLSFSKPEHNNLHHKIIVNKTFCKPNKNFV